MSAFCIISNAQAAEVATAASGIGYMLVIHEKCFGSSLTPDQVRARQDHLMDMLVANGTAFKDAQADYLRGVFLAESRYPKGTKLPKKECSDAAKMKQALDKI